MGGVVDVDAQKNHVGETGDAASSEREPSSVIFINPQSMV
jgi:hypothetical protein